MHKKYRRILYTFAFFLGVFFLGFHIFSTRGAHHSFVQSDWSGSATANIATHTDDRNSWTQYSSNDDDVIATDQLTLQEASYKKIFTSATDLTSGTHTGTSVVGIDNDAMIALVGDVRQIATGNNYSCGIKGDDGTVYCWGYNGYGQIGDGSNISRFTPTQVKGVDGVGVLTDVVSISAGINHTCVATEDGAAYCWGYNNDGQIGDNTYTTRSTPVQVKGVGNVGTLADVVQVSAGGSNTCALTSGGAVYCWGNNFSGQIGNNTSGADRLTPVQVKGVGNVGTLADVTQITVGNAHTCARTTDGSAYCWGANNYGQIGDYTSGTNRLTPVQVKGVSNVGTLDNVAQIAAGNLHTCVSATNGAAYCWGYNNNGQIGNNTSGTMHTLPVQVKGVGNVGTLANVTDIKTGFYSTCARTTDGAAYCWGYNIYGQIGDNTSGTNRLTPVQVKGVDNIGTLDNVAEIAVGNGYNTCARITDGSVRCWGYNNYGQVGDNTSGTNRLTPVLVKDIGITSVLESTTQITTGERHACARTTDGSAYCWGYNTYGQIGDDATTTRYTPVQVKGVDNVGTLANVVQIAAGISHTCASTTDGALYCWGYNYNGQVGDNTSGTNRLTPVQVKGVSNVGTLDNVAQIAAGSSHTCARTTDGSAYCWGNNSSGQLGDNTTISRLTPVQVKGVNNVGTLANVVQITAGNSHTCARTTDGSAYCWGSAYNGQLGNNISDLLIKSLTPVQVKGVNNVGTLANVVQITAGSSHTCACTTDGSAYCWGGSTYGQIGDNASIARLTPVQVKGVDNVGTLANVVEITASTSNTCARTTDGSAYCWGFNNYGQIGDGTSGTNRLTPVQVKGADNVGTLANAAGLATGSYFSCARVNDGTAKCWGYNSFAQIGDNTITNRLTPTSVVTFTPSTNDLVLDPMSSSGTYTSPVTDLLAQRDFSTLTYQKTTPSGTSLTIDVRAGNTPIPDGTWTEWYTDLATNADLSVLDGNQYIQYRANLATDDSNITPTLEEITFNYATSASLISSIYNTEMPTVGVIKVQWSENTPQGTDVQIQIRTAQDATAITSAPWCGPDDGTPGSCSSATFFTDHTGTTQAIDDIQVDRTQDQYIQYKVTLSSAGETSPSVDDIEVIYDITFMPTVATNPVSDISTTTATLAASITATGDEDPTRAIEWGTQSGTYTDECSVGTGGAGSYSCTITNLTPDTTYYYRAKATNVAGTAYGAELSFATLPEEVTLQDPGTLDIENALASSYFTVQEGNQTNAVEVRSNTIVNVTTNSAQASFPQNTTITGDGNFNFQQFTIQQTNVQDEQPTSRTAIDLGIPNEQLSFSQDITIQAYVGTSFNDQELDILYQNDGESTWHTHGTCTITNGYCTFQTNHATIYTINGEHKTTGDAPMNINTNVQATLSMDCYDPSDSNTTVQLGTSSTPGTVTAGTPAVGTSRCEVTTNDDQGYYLTLTDTNATHATLTHTDPNTSTVYEIQDLTPYTEATPNIQSWNAPTTKGLGFSVIHFPDTDTTHNTFDGLWEDTNQCPESTNPDTNAYAGIPQTPQPIAAVTAYHANTTTTDLCYKVDVPASQPSGQYTGTITFTATSDASGYYQ